MSTVKSEPMIEIVINLTQHEHDELLEAIKKVKYFANGKPVRAVAQRLTHGSFSEILKLAEAVLALKKFTEEVLVEPEV
jgi:hypothetical protein